MNFIFILHSFMALAVDLSGPGPIVYFSANIRGGKCVIMFER